MSQNRLTDQDIESIIKNAHLGADGFQSPYPDAVCWTDVFIAGTGPIGCGYARHIIDNSPHLKVIMADIGTQASPVIGEHQKNSIKYQKDIDAFVNVIKGALQTISVPPSDTFLPSLFGQAWTPALDEKLTIYGHNPNQDPQLNLKASAVTRVVGGMATHWTCATPKPHPDEHKLNPIPPAELDGLLERARGLLNVHDHEYDHSMRHTVVKDALIAAYPDRGIRSLPLAVERRQNNRTYVTWSGSDTVLGAVASSSQFALLPETRVTKIYYDHNHRCIGALLRDLRHNRDRFVCARAIVVACGAVGTPQVLFNSGIRPDALGRYLTEQSLSFCQIVMKRELIQKINDTTNPEWIELIRKHKEKYPKDPLPIPFTDPEPQVNVPYTRDFPYHVQVHRDAFSYGDVGPKADPRVIVDLRFFGRQDVYEHNMVYFGPKDPQERPKTGWIPRLTDSYGMPQPTFEYRRSDKDNERDQKMMRDMCEFASVLGSYLPGSYPQFMDPGLALHICGTTRIGNDKKTSVADACSKVHDYQNLWVGGNGTIPDSTACNPTLTSLAIALKGAESLLEYLAKTPSPWP